MSRKNKGKSKMLLPLSTKCEKTVDKFVSELKILKIIFSKNKIN